jgi:2-polyprenyl-6-methoxyphenol hydroxylase-like FAD-dependent oxidoreductase
MLARGQVINAFTLHADGRTLARLDADYATMPTAYPHSLCIDQVETEAVLREAAAGHGVRVEWGVRLSGLVQDADGVTATLQHADGRVEQARSGWLAGCDGGHSAVRKELGFVLAGTSSETWMIADADVVTDLPRNSIHWIRSRGVTMMMVPMSRPGRWRLLDTQPKAGAEVDPARTAARFGEALSRGAGRPIAIDPPTWISVFTFQQRMVTRMRSGRCFVAGDAAHVHSPASGQGLNTGLQDAVNLAWKLAGVIKGSLPEAVLDSYPAERLPIGRSLLKSTGTATTLVQLRNALAGVALPIVFTVVRGVPAIKRRIQRKVLGGVSGLRLSYAGDALTRPAPGAARGPQPGDRVTVTPGAGPLIAGHPGWTLLHAGDDAPRPTDDLAVRRITDPTVAAALGLGARDWILVRPDGYVYTRGHALRPSTVDELGVFVVEATA